MPGSIIDGGAFGGDSLTATNWYNNIAGIIWSGNQTINDGAVVSVFGVASNGTDPTDGTPLSPTSELAFTATSPAASTASTSVAATSRASRATSTPSAVGTPGSRPTSSTQGGAVFANSYAKNLQITNNMVQNNGGGYGTIRIGTPDVAIGENHNENVHIANNRIIANAGTNLAGGIGLFNGPTAIGSPTTTSAATSPQSTAAV